MYNQQLMSLNFNSSAIVFSEEILILPFWNKIDQGKDFEDSKNLFKQNP